jgi:hypothetical protein
LAAAAICALAVEFWLYFAREWDLLLAFGVIVVLPLLAVLTLYLLPLYRSKIEVCWVSVRGTLSFARWRATTLVALGLIGLCVFSWIRSHYVMDRLKIRAFGSPSLEIWSRLGKLETRYEFGGVPDPSENGGIRLDSHRLPTWQRGLIGNSGVRPRFGIEEFMLPGAGLVIVWFPHWVLLPVIGIFPAVTLFRGYRRYRRSLRNCCLECGYDLTGNVSGRCPECGLELSTATPDAATSPAGKK